MPHPYAMPTSFWARHSLSCHSFVRLLNESPADGLGTFLRRVQVKGVLGTCALIAAMGLYNIAVLQLNDFTANPGAMVYMALPDSVVLLAVGLYLANVVIPAFNFCRPLAESEYARDYEALVKDNPLVELRPSEDRPLFEGDFHWAKEYLWHQKNALAARAVANSGKGPRNQA